MKITIANFIKKFGARALNGMIAKSENNNFTGTIVLGKQYAEILDSCVKGEFVPFIVHGMTNSNKVVEFDSYDTVTVG